MNRPGAATILSTPPIIDTPTKEPIMLRSAILQIARLVLPALRVRPNRGASPAGLQVDDADLAQRVRLTGEW